VADAGSAHAEQHIAFAGLRQRNLLHLEWLSDTDEANSFHS
jgi:hypothetical protein